MFLGENLGLQRYDRLKYPAFYRLAEQQEEFYWRANEISLIKDRGDYKILSDTEKFVFDSNLKWQTATDALLNRSIIKMQEHVSLPELEACMSAWAFFESNIHSRSYSHILKNVYPDESVFWNSILSDLEITSRMDKIKSDYDALFEDDSRDLKTKIFNSIVSTNVTEGLSFYVSFACSFFFGINGKMEGNAKIIRLIERDERLHAGITTNILRYMERNPDEGFQDVYSKGKIIESFRIGTEIEKSWGEYLFSKGSLLGLNREVLSSFAEYKCNERLSLLGIGPLYGPYKKNPLGTWYDQFLNTEKIQTAPQESEITAYKISARDTNLNEDEIKDFEL